VICVDLSCLSSLRRVVMVCRLVCGLGVVVVVASWVVFDMMLI